MTTKTPGILTTKEAAVMGALFGAGLMLTIMILADRAING